VVQIDQGAPADVFASADQVQMDRAKRAGRIDGPDTVFATNRLVVIMPASNPGRINSVGDLSRAGLRIVTTQPGVPIGVYTQRMLDSMSQDSRYRSGFKDQVNANVASMEDNVRQIVAKVALGEADAGVVYRSDVTPQIAHQLATVDVPDEFNTLASYPIALVQESRNRTTASAFMAFVLSPTGQSILARWNFTPVGPSAVRVAELAAVD
jgi:molybdate transport system substrate-binding protein